MRAGPPAAPAPRRALLLVFWLPVLAYTAFIFTLSSTQTPGPTFFSVQDKSLHFIVYGLYGLLLARAFRATMRNRPGLLWAAGTVGAGSLIGVIDELYQRTVPGRTPDVRDWAADTLGLLAASLLVRLIGGRPRGRRPGAPEESPRTAPGAAP